LRQAFSIKKSNLDSCRLDLYHFREQSNDFAKTKRKEQRQCEVIQWYTTKLDQFTSESVSNLQTVNIESQEHYWERKSRSIDQKRCSRTISYRQHESNHHKLRQKANLQRDEITMIKCMKKQHQEGKSVLKAHIERESKSEITKRA